MTRALRFTLLGLAVVVILAAGCSGGSEDPIVVTGQASTTGHCTPGTVCFGGFDRIYVALHSGRARDLGRVGEPIAEIFEAEADGFALTAPGLTEQRARRLFVYVNQTGIGGSCAYINLAPLRRDGGDWVNARTGKPVHLVIAFNRRSVGGVLLAGVPPSR